MRHKIITLIILLLTTIILNGCYCLFNWNECFPPRIFSSKSQKAFFSNDTTQICQYLDLNGYFLCDEPFYKRGFERHIVFYEDESYLLFEWSEWIDKNKYTKFGGYNAELDSVKRAVNVDLNESFQNNEIWPSIFGCSRCQKGGAYRIFNGSLVLEQPCILNNHIWLLRNYFRIQDRQTLIREKCQFVSDDSIINFDTVAVFHFVPAQNKLDPFLNYAKRKKYMWRSKKEWKEDKVARKEYYRKLKYEAKHNDLESK